MKMYDNVLEKVRAYEKKKNIVYAKVDSPIYSRVKALYILALIFTLGVNFILIYSHYAFETKSLEENVLYTVLTLSVVLLITAVIMHFKKYLLAHYISLALNVFSAVGLLLSLSNVLVDEIGDLMVKFYYMHLAPLCIMVLCSAVLTYIAVTAYFKTRKTYNKILENLYEAYGSIDESKNVSEEEWEEIVKDL